MLLQAIIGTRLETLEDFSIGSLNLLVALRMCIANLDAKVLAISLKHADCELGPIVRDDPIWGPEPANDRLDKLDYGLLVHLDHMGCFWALCELVDGNV
jgi:hypothetical protein